MKLKYKNQIIDFNFDLNNQNIKLNYQDSNLNYNITEIEDNTVLINSGNSKKTAYYTKINNTIIVNIDGLSYTFDILDDEENFEFSSNENKNTDIIKSPMPGSVIKLLVNKNDLVEEGTALIIIEAMKMETTLYSSINGKITEINTTNGEQVSPDKELIKIEKITD